MPLTKTRRASIPENGLPRPRKILHICNGEYYAGAERVQDLLAENLPAFGYEVSFVCLKPDRFPAERHCQAAPLYRLPMRSAFDLARLGDVIRLIRREGYALIHTHYTRSNLIGGLAAAVTGLPLVQHIHGIIGFDSPTWGKRHLNILMEWLGTVQARQVIVVSEQLRATLRGRVGLADKIRVIHNGVPCWPGGLPDRPRPSSRPVIGVVAFWRPGKGLEVLLDALHRLRANGHSFILHVVGGFISPAYETEIRSLASRFGLLDEIRWLGPSGAVNDELQAMDLFVLPSLSEGLPMVILEAMAAGVPVVATEVGGIGEAIRSGEDGLLVPANDPDSLARAMQSLLGDTRLWTQYRESAFERQRSRFSDRQMAAGVAGVYDRLLGETSGEGER